MKIVARKKKSGLFIAALSLCAVLLSGRPGMAIELCGMPNTGWGGGTFPGVGPGHPGIGMPPFGTGGWPGAQGWGDGDVIDISKQTLFDPNLQEPAGELARTEEGERPAGGDGNQGIINLIPAIIGIIGGASGRGIPSGGSRGSSSRPAPSQKCHTSPDGTVHCGSN